MSRPPSAPATPRRAAAPLRLGALLALAALALPGAAAAQSADEEEAPRNVRYQQKTEIEFDAARLTGELVDDGLQMVVERPKADFIPLIELRRDFNDQMVGSVDEVR